MRKLWELIAWPTLQVLIGVAIMYWFKDDIGYFAAIVALVTLCLLALYTASRIMAEAYDYIRTPVTVPNFVKSEPEIKITNMGNSLYAAQSPKVTIDVYQAFARKVVRMWHDPTRVNLTQSYWLKDGSPSRFEQIGGVSQPQFSDMIDRFVGRGAFEKVNPHAKNSPVKVADINIVSAISRGHVKL
jgi:hypothetical protein